MKVAIITFHAAHNYGAVLQVYALKTYLSQDGLDVSVLDYRPLALRNPYALIPCFDFCVTEKNRYKKSWKYLKIVLHWIIKEIPFRAKRKRIFECFIRDNLNLSKNRYDSAFKSNVDYDLYVVGSDQIWNIHHTLGFDDIFWGDFDVAKGARKIIYAASMIEHDLNDAKKNYMVSCVQDNFSHVSVRERQLAVYLRGCCDKEIPVVLDPTLLVECRVWDSIAKEPLTKRKYVLVYALTCRDDAMEMANKIASQIDVNVIEIVIGNKRCLSSNQIMPSPEEFVGLFKNSEFVVTESFHGTAFSIIFEKPFVSLSRGTIYDARQKTLLEELGLLNCFQLSTARPDFFNLSFESTRKRLADLRQVSAKYLSCAITNSV